LGFDFDSGILGEGLVMIFGNFRKRKFGKFDFLWTLR
jgi:hypothetical protein